MDQHSYDNKHVIMQNDMCLRTFDLSSVENDFIYQLIDYYLDDISENKPANLFTSVNNLVDTIMSFYLLAKKNGVIDIENSRRMLALKMGKDPNNMQNKLLEQGNKMNGEFEQLEKYLLERNKKGIPLQTVTNSTLQVKTDSELVAEKLNIDLTNIDYLLSTHQDFLTDISKQNTTINHDLETIKETKIETQTTSVPIEQPSDINVLEQVPITEPLPIKVDAQWQISMTEDIIRRMDMIESKLRDDLNEIGKNITKQLETVNTINKVALPQQPKPFVQIYDEQTNQTEIFEIGSNAQSENISNENIESMARKSKITYADDNQPESKVWEKDTTSRRSRNHSQTDDSHHKKFNSMNTTDCLYPDNYQLDDNLTATDTLSDISSDDLTDHPPKREDKKHHKKEDSDSSSESDSDSDSDSEHSVHKHKKSKKEPQSDKLDEVFDKLYKRLNSPLINLLIAVIIIRILYSLFGF